MLLYPNCKLNIGLRVIDRRTDGYHDLETIFYPVYDLHDELEIRRFEDLKIRKFEDLKIRRFEDLKIKVQKD